MKLGPSCCNGYSFDTEGWGISKSAPDAFFHGIIQKGLWEGEVVYDFRQSLFQKHKPLLGMVRAIQMSGQWSMVQKSRFS